MSSTLETPDLSPLTDTYEVLGEIGGRDHIKTLVGRRIDDGRDVLISLMTGAADVAQGKAIAQFAADANLLATLRHPSVPQVLEGRWIGEDAFALVSDRVHGTTLAELMAGDRLPNPRIADILSDVNGVLEWARGERIVHRGVRPDQVIIERGTGRVYVTLSPTETPKANRPDPRDDARTIGILAMAMLTANPVTDDHDGTLATMRPDLPQRVIDATEKAATITTNDEPPNVAAYLASVAMADAIKEGELEVARVDAEFRAAMKAERDKWEAEQAACQLENEEQAKKFAEERSEYDRRSAKEREQLAAARAEIDKRRAEVQQARMELDQARDEFKQKKTELEGRVKTIDRHARDLEKGKRDLQKRSRELEKRTLELERKSRELEASSAAAAASETSIEALKARINQSIPRIDETRRPTVPVDVVAGFNRPTMPVDAVTGDGLDEPELGDTDVDGAPEVAAGLGTGIESAEDVRTPWTPIEEAKPWSVPLVTDEPVGTIAYDAAAVPESGKRSGRPAWVIPTSALAFLFLLVGTALTINRRHDDQADALALLTATSPARTTPVVPGAVVTDSAAGTVAPVPSDSAEFNAIRDSIVQADAERAARRAREAADQATATKAPASGTVITDSNGVKWTTVPPPPLDSVKRAMAASAAMTDSAIAARAAARKDSAAKKDSAKAKKDTLVKPDTGTFHRT